MKSSIVCLCKLGTVANQYSLNSEWWVRSQVQYQVSPTKRLRIDIASSCLLVTSSIPVLLPNSATSPFSSAQPEESQTMASEQASDLPPLAPRQRQRSNKKSYLKRGRINKESKNRRESIDSSIDSHLKHQRKSDSLSQKVSQDKERRTKESYHVAGNAPLYETNSKPSSWADLQVSKTDIWANLHLGIYEPLTKDATCTFGEDKVSHAMSRRGMPPSPQHTALPKLRQNNRRKLHLDSAAENSSTSCRPRRLSKISSSNIKGGYQHRVKRKSIRASAA